MSSNFIKYRPHSPLDVKKGYSQQGFTLIELLITITILAILMSIAVPNIQNSMAKQKVKDTTADFLTALRDAKAESIIRDDDITLTYSSSNNTLDLLKSDQTKISSRNIADSNTITMSSTKIVFSKNKTATDSTIQICNTKGKIKEGTQIVISPSAVISVKGAKC